MIRQLLRLIVNERFDLPDADSIHGLMDDAFARLSKLWLGNTMSPGSGGGGVIQGMSLIVTDADPAPLVSAQINTGVFMDSDGHCVDHLLTDAIPCDLSAVSNIAGAIVWGRRIQTPLQVSSENRVVIVAGAEDVQAIETRYEYRMEFQATVAAAPAGTGWAKVISLDAWTDQGGWFKPTTTTVLRLFGRSDGTGGTAGTILAVVEAVQNALALFVGGGKSWYDGPTRDMETMDADLATAESLNATQQSLIGVNATDIGIYATKASQRFDAHSKVEDPEGLDGDDFAARPWIGEYAHSKVVCEFKHDLTLVRNHNSHVASVANPGVGRYVLTLAAGKVRIANRVAIAVVDWKGDDGFPPPPGWGGVHTHARPTADDGTYITEITVHVGTSGGAYDMSSANTCKVLYF